MAYESNCSLCECVFKTEFPPNVQPFVDECAGKLFDFECAQPHFSDDDEEQHVVYDDVKQQFVGDGKFAVVLKFEQSPLCNQLDPKVHGFCHKCLPLAQRDKCNVDAMHTLFETAQQFVVKMLLPCDPRQPQPECPNAVQDDVVYVSHNNPTMRLLFEHQQSKLLSDFQSVWLQNVAGLTADATQQVISKCTLSGDYDCCAHVGDLTNTQWLNQLEENVFASALHDVKHVVENLNRMQSQKRMRCH